MRQHSNSSKDAAEKVVMDIRRATRKHRDSALGLAMCQNATFATALRSYTVST
jgi:hypothetical protein